MPPKGSKKPQGETAGVGDVLAAINGMKADIERQLDAINSRVDTIERQRGDKLAVIAQPEKLVEDARARSMQQAAQQAHDNGEGAMVPSSRTFDLRNMGASRGALQPNTVVRLTPNADLYQRLMNNVRFRETSDGEVMGAVQKFVYLNKRGERCYIVKFPKVGTETVPQDELEVVRDAV